MTLRFVSKLKDAEMIHHLSIAAKDPKRVALAIAALWRGEAFPFPPVARGSWVAMAGDARSTTIEVYPFGSELRPTEGPSDAHAESNAAGSPFTATHAAIATPLAEEEVFALAEREGWIAKYCKRGGKFGVIEFWLEDCVLIEVLTAEMQAEYTTFATPENFRAIFGAAAA
jgi:hypothetical protein